VAAAEECGQIGALGAWVLRTAAAQAKCWVDAGLRPIRIAVNISGHQLRHPSILETIREALEASGLGAGWLELELTESTIIRDDQLTNKILREISELGVGLALDDFGTGFSSLSNLRRLPIGRVKIDRSFVADLPRCQDDCAVVGAIIAMAHSLRIPVVAEGVETEEQLEFLRERGCEEVQGYLFSPAVPPEALTRMLELEKEDGLGAV
jgi:EAL domain-containing protein (putative c-di-GMP-specific phosphodiesterase class I)